MTKFSAYFGLNDAMRVIDIGGTPYIWTWATAKPSVTLVNLRPNVVPPEQATQFTSIAGDATAVAFPNNSFDLVFSNSLIEHLGTWENQVKCAGEIRRLAPAYFVQTPARRCLIEPHYMLVLGHWLPRAWQPFLLRYLSLWGLTGKPDRARIDELLQEIRLLSKREMQALFPDAEIATEWFLFLPKSYIARKRPTAS